MSTQSIGFRPKFVIFLANKVTAGSGGIRAWCQGISILASSLVHASTMYTSNKLGYENSNTFSSRGWNLDFNTLQSGGYADTPTSDGFDINVVTFTSGCPTHDLVWIAIG